MAIGDWKRKNLKIISEICLLSHLAQNIWLFILPYPNMKGLTQLVCVSRFWKEWGGWIWVFGTNYSEECFTSVAGHAAFKTWYTSYQLYFSLHPLISSYLPVEILLYFPVLLEGSPGVGKTSLIVALGKFSGHKVVRINLSEQVGNFHFILSFECCQFLLFCLFN